MNRVTLMGRLGRDPELRYTQGGTAVCNFSVATSERYKDKSGNRQEHTEWHRIVVWGVQAENCQKYLEKGRQVLLEGKIKANEWEDSDGNKRTTTEIVASNVTFLSGGSDSQGGSNSSGNWNRDSESKWNNQNQSGNQPVGEDDIPF